jgi:hypothetical protein
MTTPFLSKKHQRILSLFDKVAEVPFRKVMHVGKYLTPTPAYNALISIMGKKDSGIQFSIINSTVIKTTP